MTRCFRWILPVLFLALLSGLLVPWFQEDNVVSKRCVPAPGPSEQNPKKPETASGCEPERGNPARPGPRTGAPLLEANPAPAPVSGVLRGRVREKGCAGGLPGVHVRIDQGGVHCRKRVTDPDGAFQFNGLKPGVWAVQARTSTHLPASRSVRVRQDEESVIDVVLSRGIRLEVRVEENGTGKSLSGVRVRFWSPSTSTAREGKTDEAGRVVLPGLPGAHWPDGHIQVEHPEYLLLASASHGVFERTGETGALVRMVRSASLSGRILEPGGAPAAGMLVFLDCAKTAWKHLVTPRAEEEQAGVSVVDRMWCRTDGEGVFCLDAFPPLEAAVVVIQGKDRAPEARVVTLDPGEVRKGLEIRLRQDVRLGGLVVDPSGKPVSSAQVVVARSDQIFKTLETGAKGTFLLSGLGPGAYGVKAKSRGWIESVPRKIRISRGGLPDPLRLTLRQEAPPIEGVVVDGEGRGLAGMEVAAFGVQKPGLFQEETFWPATDETDGNGRFHLEGLREDWTYEVRVNVPGLHRSVTRGPVAPGTSGLFIQVETPGGLIGIVPATLEASVVRVEAIQEKDPSQAVSRAYASSPFQFSGLAPGLYRVVGRAGDGSVVAVAGNVRILPGKMTDGVRLLAVPGVKIAGCVVDASGRPLAGVSIATFQGLRSGNPVRYETRTDAAGRFILGGLGPGTVDLIAGNAGMGFTVRRAIRAPTRHLRISLHPTVTIRVAVKSRETQRPIRRAEVGLLTRGLAAVRLLTDREGQAVFRTSPGDYAVVVAADGFRSQGNRVPATSAGREEFREFILSKEKP